MPVEKTLHSLHQTPIKHPKLLYNDYLQIRDNYYWVVSDLKRSYPAVSQIWIYAFILIAGKSKSLFENSTPIVDERSFGGA